MDRDKKVDTFMFVLCFSLFLASISMVIRDNACEEELFIIRGKAGRDRVCDKERFLSYAESYRKKMGVNINSAGVEDLSSLPGIGPAIAKRIIAYRERKGGSMSLEDLGKIKGIGPAKIRMISEKIEYDRGTVFQ
ncbi:MAG: ComEA family DNA-binding protein [Candidatus Omnitrophica bacterium]|nr:ComEA family DNA-binding protein [Candidatus Omnitrophota bacterium]MDD5488687.1 ComEA family DNA-binding protein [Candidatus Omnitrophota bacterium]